LTWELYPSVPLKETANAAPPVIPVAASDASIPTTSFDVIDFMIRSSPSRHSGIPSRTVRNRFTGVRPAATSTPTRRRHPSVVDATDHEPARLITEQAERIAEARGAAA
jgi:hypothetical protein